MNSAVMLTLPGCTHCVKSQPVFESTMQANKYDYEILDIVKSERGKVLVESFKVEKFPTVLLFKEDRKSFKKIEGSLTAEKLEKVMNDE